MNDDTPRSREPQVVPSTQKYKTITQEEFDEKLTLHYEWLALNDVEKEKQNDKRLVLEKYDLRPLNLYKRLRGVNFSGSDLREVDLNEADLYGANLTEANLWGSHLRGACLEGAFLIAVDLTKADLTQASLEGAQLKDAKFLFATLSKANFQHSNLMGASFSGVDFQDADLSHANLRNAKLVKTRLEHVNTDGAHFGGSNVSHAHMPLGRYFEDRITIINESTRMVRTLFLTLLGALAFCSLTILSTQDSQLLNFAVSFKLPIIGTNVSIKWFYYLAPWFLLGLFAYFHLYLIKHYWLIAKQPRIFPDNSGLGDKILPWVLNSWAIHYFEDSKGKREGIQWVRGTFSLWLVWLATPLCLLFFWIRSFASQNKWLIETHFWVVVISLVLAWGFGRIAQSTLSTRGWGMEEAHHWEYVLNSVELVVLYVLLVILGSGKALTPDVLSQYFSTPDISYQEVSIKPENWNPKNPTAGVRGADLSDKDLSNVKANYAFLIKANLSKTSGIRANFKSADLRGADLKETNYREANFTYANLTEANLSDGADFSRADFRKAHLKKANLAGINLTGALLNYADLTKAYIAGAELSDAHLSWANLTESDLSGVSLISAFLSHANFTGAYLNYADLTGANLSGANVSRANFSGAILTEADLSETDLTYADFRFSKNQTLAIDQVKEAKNWRKAFFDDSFRKKLEITNEHLRELIDSYIKNELGDLSKKELLKSYGLISKLGQ